MASSSKVIVVFKNGTPSAIVDAAAAALTAQGGVIGHKYDQSIIGFSATIPDTYITTLASNPELDFIEADGPVSIAAKKYIK